MDDSYFGSLRNIDPLLLLIVKDNAIAPHNCQNICFAVNAWGKAVHAQSWDIYASSKGNEAHEQYV